MAEFIPSPKGEGSIQSMILVIKHIDIEGPGLLGKFLKTRGHKIQTIDLSQGSELPEDISGLEAVMSLGGPMNVYEEEKYPFLKSEDIFIKKVLANGIPFLGLCLGAQLLAKASDAKVKKAEHEEIGFYKVELTKEGLEDKLFEGLEKDFDVFQWHGDTFDVPRKGVLLATSKLCRNQAFRLGKSAYGLQFHLEVEEKDIRDWINEYESKKGIDMLKSYESLKHKLTSSAQKVCRNFEKLTLD